MVTAHNRLHKSPCFQKEAETVLRINFTDELNLTHFSPLRKPSSL